MLAIMVEKRQITNTSQMYSRFQSKDGCLLWKSPPAFVEKAAGFFNLVTGLFLKGNCLLKFSN